MSDVIQTIKEAVQATEPQNVQDLLWGLTTDTWWKVYSTVCAIGAVLLFRQILYSVERNALTYARMLWLGGFIIGAGVPFNSGCQPLSAMLFAASGTLMTVLLSTRWCQRPGTPWDKTLAIVREMFRQPNPNGR